VNWDLGKLAAFLQKAPKSPKKATSLPKPITAALTPYE